MNNVKPHSTSTAGRTLLASHDLAAGEEIIGVERPFAAALDSKHLPVTCGTCFLWLPSGVQGAPGVELKACLACKVVRYCSKTCQTRSWKDGHRYECPIFKTLYPNILPNTVRLLLQPLLRKHNRSLTEETWQNFLGLQSHVKGFKAASGETCDGLTTWQTLELMSQATLKYSGIKEPLEKVQAMLARVMINTHTFTTPTLDPLGLCLEPLTALLNHSCTPNAYIVFDGNVLSVRSLTPIPSDTEITISYIDTTNPTGARRAELQSRYFFACSCPACTTDLTNGEPDVKIPLRTQQLIDNVISIQSKAATVPPSEAEEQLTTALSILDQSSYPRHHQPHAALLHSTYLAATATQNWPLAVRSAMLSALHVEHLHFPESWHPVRVVRRWVLLRLVCHIARLEAEGEESVRGLRQLGVNWMVVSCGLWREVKESVAKSHGSGGRFAREVEAFAESVGFAGAPLDQAEMHREWFKLSKVAGGFG